MPREMSAVWRVRHIFQACGMKAAVVSVAAALPIQSVVSMVIVFAVFVVRVWLSWCAQSGIMVSCFVLFDRVELFGVQEGHGE
jgi:hypothetical protein